MNHDVIIVGAGLSGLSAAYALRDLDTVVLEREGRAGGRVDTRSRQNVAYDMGAVLAVNPRTAALPESPLPALRAESERIGVHLNGTTHFGSSVVECVNQALSPKEREGLEAYARDSKRGVELLPASAYRALNSFFRAIHPGELNEYCAERQGDSLLRYPVFHHETGNGFLVERYAEQLQRRLRLQTAVDAVVDRGDHVEVTLSGAAKPLRARAVICAVPGPHATRLLESSPIALECRAFLKALRWGEGLVVALGLRGAELADFSYLVTPDLELNTVLRHEGVLLVYYVGKAAARLKAASREAVVEQTLGELRTLGIGALADRSIAWSDVQHWPLMGAMITEEAYGRWTEAKIRPSERVFLAGDYTFVEPGNPFPFGTDEAMKSGHNVATKVKAFLAEESRP